MIGDRFSDLLIEVRAGDEAAFGELWRDLQPPLLRYLRVVVRGAAEDVASETWARVARDLARFEGSEAAFRAWLFTIARHRALDWRRYEARRPTDPHPVEAFADRPAGDDPEATVVAGDALDAALALIATLPRDQAEVVVLRVVGGLDVAAVAQVLGKRPGAIRVLAHRGLRQLAARLGSAEQAGWRVTP
jgi:RNA polymerase sigma-70 factor (ECF subfamily)